MASVSSARALYAIPLLLLVAILHEPGLAQGFPYRTRSLLQASCQSSSIQGKSGNCNTEHGSDCCVDGETYTTYGCSPPVIPAGGGGTPATLTLNSFRQDGDGGGRAACTGLFYGDDQMVVALSTGWYADRGRCPRSVVISAAGTGRSVTATVVDECDSAVGCDGEHNFEVPCPNNVVDGSLAVWDALGLSQGDGEAQITWSDA